MRYASMMPLGSLILKVVSTTKADSMWYFPLLVPYDWKSDQAAGGGVGGAAGLSSGSGTSSVIKGDHIVIAADFSDLADAISWAKSHDSTCEAIAANAQALYDRLIAVDGQLDYMQLLCTEVAARFHSKEGGASSGGGSSGSGEVPTPLLPAVCQPPRPGADWFGAASEAYSAVALGAGAGSAQPPPFLPALATGACACPNCCRKRESAEAARAETAAAEAAAVAAAAAARRVAEAARSEAVRAAAAAAAARSSGGGGRGSSSSAAASQRAALPLGSEFKDLNKARAAAVKAAEAARAAAAATAAAAAAATHKRPREG